MPDEPAPTLPPAEPAPPPRAAGPSAYISTPKKAHARRRKDEGDHRRGLAQRPDAAETRLADSLLYPFWDGNGVTMLVVLPVGLWLTSIPVFGILPMVIQGGGGLFLMLGVCAFPMALLWGLVVGYLLLYLGQILAASATGEVFHPRAPEWDMGEIARGIGRWSWAIGAGFVLGGLPAMVYWIRCGDLDWFDRIVLVELIALGAVYGQMALAAALLHDTMWAAHPVTVVAAIRRIGWPYAVPCLVSGVYIAVGVAGLIAVLEAKGPALGVGGLWAFWLWVVYGGMVVMRALGLCYYRNARRLGWFRDRPRWGVRFRV